MLVGAVPTSRSLSPLPNDHLPACAEVAPTSSSPTARIVISALRFTGAHLRSLQQSHDDTGLPATGRVHARAAPVTPPDARAGHPLPRHRRIHRPVGEPGAP